MNIFDTRLREKIIDTWSASTLRMRAVRENQRKRMEMFSVVGLTLDEVSSGALPHVRLAKALDNRMSKSNFRFAEIILVYTTVETDTQGSVARTKYREQGQFLVFLYFNDAAVEACKEMGIPIRVLDRIDESELPSRRSTVLERPYLAPVSK
jgi:hypothetical protein